MAEFLNPGSKEAVEAGCTCPQMDNGYGAGYMGGVRDEKGQLIFVTNGDCPLHGFGESEEGKP